MNNLIVGVVGVRATKAQVKHDVPEFEAQVLRQIRCLFQDCAQDVAVENRDPASTR